MPRNTAAFRKLYDTAHAQGGFFTARQAREAGYVELRGNLAAMLTAAQQTKRSPETGDLLVPVQLVAGARNQLNLEFSWAAA